MSLKVTAEAAVEKANRERIVLKLTRSMRAGLVVATVPETMGFKIGPVTAGQLGQRLQARAILF